MSFFANKQSLVADILSRYPAHRKRSAVMPLLREVQTAEGFVSDARVVEIAQIIESTPTEVKSVMSFYSTYSSSPTGKYHLQVCMTLSCALAGSDQLWDYLCETLDIGVGDVTPDGLFSVQRVECLGSCGTAPVMQVSDTGYYECLTKKRLNILLEQMKNGVLPDSDTRAPVFVQKTGDFVQQCTADGQLAGGNL
ncbi:MAG: NADH-quinone oxidoreductase subunit NuoE [Deinococcales bacterium]